MIRFDVQLLARALSRRCVLMLGTSVGYGLGFNHWTCYRNRRWPPTHST